MDVASFGIAGVTSITILCYVVGEFFKNSKLDNKWIPVICPFVGMALGVIAMFVMPDFPGTDIVTALAVGAASGLSATGVNQVVKQLSK